MATQTTTTSGGIQTTQTNQQQFLLFGCKFASGTYNNSTGSTITIAQGTVVGRINATGLIGLMASTNTDGSQVPIGVTANAYTVANGANQVISYVVSGQINQGTAAAPGITFANGTDTLDTIILLNSNVPAATTTELGLVRDIFNRQGLFPTYLDEATYSE